MVTHQKAIPVMKNSDDNQANSGHNHLVDEGHLQCLVIMVRD